MLTPLRISGMTRNLGAPENWKSDSQGPCISLPIRDHQDASGANWMVSRYEFTPDDIARIVDGKPLELWIAGVAHPVIRLLVPDE